MRDSRTAFTFAIVFTLTMGTAQAQQSHIERLQQAALTCLDGVVSGVEALNFQADERAPYIRSGLIDAWMRSGMEVFRPDSSTVVAGRFDLGYRIDDVRIVLKRVGSKRAERRAVVAMHYSLIDPDRRIVADDLCTGEQTDTLQVDLIAGLSDARFPETDVQLSDRGLLRRIVEPVVVLGAAVIGTYLFFNLRSKRTEGG